MSEAIEFENKRGLFRRETKGMSLEPATVQVERSRIRFFAQVLGDINPLYRDVDAARAEGYPDIIAPPSFFMVLEALAHDELLRGGHPDAAKFIGCDFRYLLHGNENYSFTGFICAGDELQVTTTVLDFFDKKGGAMEFAVLESLLTHAERGVLVRTKRTLLHKLD